MSPNAKGWLLIFAIFLLGVWLSPRVKALWGKVRAS
jgi:hypothetical protein